MTSNQEEQLTRAAEDLTSADVVDVLLDEVKRMNIMAGFLGIQAHRPNITEAERNIIDAQIGLIIANKQLCFDRLKCLGYEMTDKDLKQKHNNGRTEQPS